MTLGELINILGAEDPALLLPEGFANPHSYRGYYDELAFSPARDVTVGTMLDAARSAVGATFEGWHGGDFTMSECTDCWLAVEGREGEGLGPVILRLMIAAGKARGGRQLAGLRARLAAVEDIARQFAGETVTVGPGLVCPTPAAVLAARVQAAARGQGAPESPALAGAGSTEGDL